MTLLDPRNARLAANFFGGSRARPANQSAEANQLRLLGNTSVQRLSSDWLEWLQIAFVSEQRKLTRHLEFGATYIPNVITHCSFRRLETLTPTEPLEHSNKSRRPQ